MELAVRAGQCLDRRIPDRSVPTTEVTAWEQARNPTATTIDWRCTTDDARSKPKRLYPSHLP